MKKIFSILTISFLFISQLPAQSWLTLGNTGTGSFQSFVGTSDNADLNFRIYNVRSGIINFGFGNTALGYQTMLLNTICYNNSAFGSATLKANTTGSNNAVFGTGTLEFNTTGSDNSSFGYSSMFLSTTGSKNSAFGSQSLFRNIGGSGNTAAGYNNLMNNTSGNYNTALGYNALSSNTTGSQNVSIGYNSGTNAGAFTNTVSIGNNGWMNGYHNQVFLGNASTTWIGGWVGWSIYSDARMKMNVSEDVKGLDFIKRLRPVTYQRSIRKAVQISGNKETDDYPQKYDAEKETYSGFLAQEVEKAAQESGYNFSGLHKPKTSTDLYSLNYESFVVPLVKAVQEQQTIIEKQNERINTLEKKLNDLLSLMASK